MTDAEVIEATRRGDREAFALLVVRYQRMVEAVAFCACGQRALVDDIVQDTYITAWRTIDRLRDPGKLRAWLTSIARNVARNARRRDQTRREAPLVDASTLIDASDLVAETERDREIASALERLPRRYREPIVLFYYEHCTVKEVADALALREDAVMQRLSRGRRKLGEVLATRVEISLESKKSRAALAACVLALLPMRTASAAPAAAPVLSKLAAYGRAVLPWLVAHWRIPAAMLACVAAAIGLGAAIERSDAIAARAHAAAAPPPPPPVKPTPQGPRSRRPHLPDRDERFMRNLVVASTDPAETCGRAAAGLVAGAIHENPIKGRNGELYYEPSPELVRIQEAVREKAAASCEGQQWHELYVMCEGTVFDVLDGDVTCYPYDPYATDLAWSPRRP